MKIEVKSVVDAVADSIVEMIVSGQISAGDVLAEGVLAESMHVSRNSVREAIRGLRATGLVAHYRNKGTMVTTPSRHDIEELYQARQSLEIGAIRSGFRPEQLAAVRTAYDLLAETSATGDKLATVRRDLAFHMSIVDLYGNSRLSEFFRNMMTELLFCLRSASYHEDTMTTAAEHQPIMSALSSGDCEEAASLLAKHIDLNGRKVLALF